MHLTASLTVSCTASRLPHSLRLPSLPHVPLTRSDVCHWILPWDVCPPYRWWYMAQNTCRHRPLVCHAALPLWPHICAVTEWPHGVHYESLWSMQPSSQPSSDPHVHRPTHQHGHLSCWEHHTETAATGYRIHMHATGRSKQQSAAQRQTAVTAY